MYEWVLEYLELLLITDTLRRLAVDREGELRSVESFWGQPRLPFEEAPLGCVPRQILPSPQNLFSKIVEVFLSISFNFSPQSTQS